MNLNAPKQITWLIAVILGVVGIVGHYAALGAISGYSFVLVCLGFVLLALGTLLKGL